MHTVSNTNQKNCVEMAICKIKNRLKVYNVNNLSSVFLNNGDRFEIELYNRTSSSKMCKIKMNGVYISTQHLVLRPAERVYLDCNPTNKDKFIFKTYQINSDDRELVANNGLIEIEWYEQKNDYDYTITYSSYPFSSGGFIKYPNKTSDKPDWTYYNSPTCTYNDSICNVQSSYTCDNVLPSLKQCKRAVINNMDTGRIEFEGKSDQQFNNIQMNFYDTPFHTDKIKLIPETTKNIYFDEISRYCSNCGTKIKKTSWKFCPNCGEKF